MLTSDLIRPHLRRYGSTLEIRMLPTDNAKWLQSAADIIAIFGQHIGQPRHQVNTALEVYEGIRTDYITLRGFAKVISDSAQFHSIPTPLPPAEIRQQLFAQGPVFAEPDLFHPHSRAEVLGEWCEEYLFADLPNEYLLTQIEQEWTPTALIERYNLELARGVLYWATEMQIHVQDSYKDFWRYVKLFKLMFEATLHPDGGYQVLLDGPISPFVKSSTRYGRQFAVFLPALFLCEHWSMKAKVRQFDDTLVYSLDDRVPLVSHFHKSNLFDSWLEADFAHEFATKLGETRGKWTLHREDEVLLLGDQVMIPDFSLVHEDGRRAIIEIMGFWHPEYLRRKIAKIHAAQRHNLILIVYEGVNLTERHLEDIPSQVLYFKTKPVLKDVMALVEQVAE